MLIADGNFQFSTGPIASARRVFLNLSPGIVNVTDVLRVIVDAVPLEGAEVMLPPGGEEPSIHREFREILPGELELEPMSRATFYEVTQRPDMALVVATGDQRLYANILLTIGYIKPE